jgi:hypothetical protein
MPGYPEPGGAARFFIARFPLKKNNLTNHIFL